MNVYEIDSRIEEILANAVDENGEINPEALEQLEALQMEREQKAENCALAYKNHKANAKAIEDEIKVLTKRMKAEERQAESAGGYLKIILNGEKMKTARVSVSYRESQAVEITDTFWIAASDEFIRVKDPEPNRIAITAALKAGETVPGARLVNRTSMIIK